MSFYEKLKSFVEDIELDISIDEVEKILEEADHLVIIRKFCEYFILEKEKKRNCIFVYGEANSGKTRIGEFLAKFFDTYEYEEVTGDFEIPLK